MEPAYLVASEGSVGFDFGKAFNPTVRTRSLSKDLKREEAVTWHLYLPRRVGRVEDCGGECITVSDLLHIPCAEMLLILFAFSCISRQSACYFLSRAGEIDVKWMFEDMKTLSSSN